MAKRMLVEATHPEETRVAVVSGNKLEELDFEIASRRQLKGNIYLAKVTRVEPSLQAAFVEYGGNRHGFLAFSEIHPDYYRIPVADREALLAQERAEADAAERAEAERDAAEQAAEGDGEYRPYGAPHGDADDTDGEAADEPGDEPKAPSMPAEYRAEERSEALGAGENVGGENVGGDAPEYGNGEASGNDASVVGAPSPESAELVSETRGSMDVESVPEAHGTVEELGGEETGEAVEERRRPRPIRSYKIQEVIKRRQILLVQVVKEERGNKGAALTTYLSLPGRYCVLMPNTGRGGGISRKITNPQDRKRLKEILSDLDIPDGMAVILRTAGLERSKQEIKRDLEYLLRLWDSIREQTLQSTAPALIYEEANLIKRAMRDLYSSDIDEVYVEGENGYRMAKDFMRMLMPSHAKKIQPYRDESIPLFFRYQVETQIDAIHNPVVQLRSGGYLVINQTEALVAIDVNSGRSTKERNIEETALRTNLEAAEEVARQLRLRDLAGLIVIDFIDMEDPKNNAAVERRLKEAMKNDRARIQLGRISPFGLLELSRQRLRPSLIETNFEKCPTCQGTGLIRSIESAALYVLRAIEEEGIRKRSSEITVHTATRIALYILNQKRDALADMERRYAFRVYLFGDDSLTPPEYRLERIKARSAAEEAQPIISHERILAETDRILEREAEQEEADIAEAEEGDEAEEQPAAETAEERADRRRRRRRRRGRREDGRPEAQAEATAVTEEAAADGEAEAEAESEEDEEEEELGAANQADSDEHPRKKRRRGKRGGRRRSRGRAEYEPYGEEPDGAEAAEPGETPAVPAQPPVPAQPEATSQPVIVSSFEDDLGDVFGDLDVAASEPIGPVPATGPMPSADEEPRVEAVERVEPPTEQPAPEAEAQPAPAGPVEAEAPAKKPRKRAATPRKRKPAEPAEAVTEAPPATAVEPAEAAPTEEQAAPAAEAEAVPAKKTRKRSTAATPAKRAATPRKRKKAEPAETEPQAEPATPEPTGEAPSPEPGPAEPPQNQPSVEPVAEGGQPEGSHSSESYEVIEEAPATTKPKRGWWSRP